MTQGIVITPEQSLKLTTVALHRAKLARDTPAKFFEFVLREETSRQPIRVAPHQRVLIDFVEAHDRSVVRMPVGHGKTYNLAGLLMRRMGQDPTRRGAIVSATRSQAEKPLGMVRDYVEHSPELRLVYPDLKPSQRLGDQWSQHAITVDRPYGIRDASLMAVGYEGALEGARLNDIAIDDILNQENTSTKEHRDKLYNWVDGTVLSRLDPRGARVTVWNTAWDPDDLTFRLEKHGWPTISMDIEGNITITNTDWDSPDLRPETQHSLDCRLVAHDPDTRNEKTLWPDRVDRVGLEVLKKLHLPARYNQLYRQKCRSDEQGKCKQAWIDQCKDRGRGVSMVGSYRGNLPTFTGVDLAAGMTSSAGKTAFFTFVVYDDGARQILDIETGRWTGPEIVDKLFEKQDNYQSTLRVENNGVQRYIQQFALVRNKSLPVRAHQTGSAKADPHLGIEGLIVEFYNAAWIIPCDKHGNAHQEVQEFLNALLYYEPGPHTPDVLMAAYFAQAQAREFGIPTGGQVALKTDDAPQGSFAAMVMAR